MSTNKNRNWVYWVLVLISAVTVLSGAAQMFKPALILGIIEGEQSSGNLHSFAIVGMFMVLFGGLLLHALLGRQHHPVAVFWAGLQKLGAFAAVGLGVTKGLFASIAWLVALFDLASGILILVYWLGIRQADNRSE